MQEPEQKQCGTTHYAGCACHVQGWQNKVLQLVADIRAAVGDPTGKLMQDELVEHCRTLRTERDQYRMMAGELIAAIRINSLRGTFATCTHDDIELWLKPWIARLNPSPSAPSAPLR